MALVGCGGKNNAQDDAAVPGDDAKMDAPADAKIDGPVDSAIDSAVDAGIDAAADGPAIDAPAIDASIDAPPVDAAVDAPPPIDAPPDAPPCPNPNEERCNGSTCTNVLTDNTNCGSCGNDCTTQNKVCSAGICCAAGQTNCNGVCVDTTSDEANCGTCGINCGQGNTCSNSKCCAGTQTNCGGTCFDLTDNDTHCGSCTNNCISQGKVCDDGICCAATQENCGGTCTNTNTSNTNCGACGNNCLTQNKTCSSGICCPSGQTNSNGICCPTGQINCNGVCTNTTNDDLNCGGCNTVQNPTACDPGEVCQNSNCVPNCVAGFTLCNGQCINTSNDPSNCGGCGTTCSGGKTCSNSTCSCPANTPDTCVIGGVPTCVDNDNDNLHCGASCTNCTATGKTCTNGVCCAPGQVACNGVCKDLSSDEANCGDCGNACPANSECKQGTCDCGFNQVACNGQCVTPSVDSQNCGQCGNTCNAGEFCVSNGCIGSCPAPTVACGTECVNPSTDNENCGAAGTCGTPCAAGKGCSQGVCVTPIPINDTRPAGTCAGGGPPIDIFPTSSGGCTGQIAANTFTFALCSCTNVDSTHIITTDGFDSTQGPYTPGQNGAGIGVNNTITDNALITVGGDLFVAGSIDPTVGDFNIHQRMLIDGNFKFSKLVTVQEDSFIGGTITKQGSGSFVTVDVLTTPNCPPNGGAGGVQYGSCVAQAVNVDPPCDCNAQNQGVIDVRAVTAFFSNPANNDNDEIGLPITALDNPSGTTRLDLPCGRYYFNSIGGSAPITIVAHGHVGIFIGGSVAPSSNLNFDLDPTSTLDVFIGGVEKIAGAGTTVGSPLYPRLTRFFIGSASTSGSGACLVNADCTSGICQANKQCANGAGGNLSDALQTSGNTFLNGLFYAGTGRVFISNPLEMFGAVFAQNYQASADTLIHFDRAAVGLAAECNEVPPSSCTTCEDCNGQACGVFGFCTSCVSDFDCCQPLRCNSGSCELIP